MWVKLNGRDNNACMQPSEKLLKKWLRIFVKDSRPLKALDNAPFIRCEIAHHATKLFYFKKNPMVEKDNNA